MTLLSVILHATNFRNPFLRTLVPAIGSAFALQAAVGIPSIIAQSERFYDVSGSLTYLSVTALSLYLPTLRARAAATAAGSAVPPWPSLNSAFTGTGGPNGLNWRQVVLSAAVSFWATRLGTYLFQRILADGKDSRFDKIKTNPVAFLGAWVAQATWVSLCLMPVLAVNSIPASVLSTLPAIGIFDIIGLSLFVGGQAIEIAADRQKHKWVQDKKCKLHDEDFITKGLWGKSRHPNYFGEITLWTGIATAAAGVLAGNVGQVGMGLSGTIYGRLLALGMSAISPAFVSFLLLKVSGVPMSEKKYDKKYGNRKDYQQWRNNTPMIIPKLW